jgi:hypothetical protein
MSRAHAKRVDEDALGPSRQHGPGFSRRTAIAKTRVNALMVMRRVQDTRRFALDNYFGRIDVICPSCQCVAGNSLATSGKSQALFPASRASQEGRFAVVTSVGCGMRWTRRRQLTSDGCRGRRSRVVLTPRRWRHVGDDASHRADNGDKKARSPGRARRNPLKPIAQETPDCTGQTCGD